jgi:hypothetical protein
MASSWEDYPEATNVIYDSDKIIQRGSKLGRYGIIMIVHYKGIINSVVNY